MRARVRQVLFFLLVLVLIEGLEAHARGSARLGVYFTAWTSERMMQTVSVRELVAEPVRSLFFLHIQPPALDLLRAIFVRGLGPEANVALLTALDQRLTHLWAVFAALLAALLFRGLEAHGKNVYVAFIGAALFALHPALLLYATIFDTTLLTALLVMWLAYEFGRLRENGLEVVWPRLAAIVILLFLTRSIFQWSFFGVVLASLWLLGAPRRAIFKFAAVVGLVMGLYTVKQQAVFGITTTSSYEGMNLMRSIGANCPPPQALPPAHEPALEGVPVLSRLEKITGDRNHNVFTTLDYLPWQRACFFATFERRSLSALARNYLENTTAWLKPSSSYLASTLVDPLPWRRLYDFIWSGGSLALLSTATLLAMVRRARATPGGLRRLAALALPFVFIVFVSIFCERGETERFKFFVEPLLYACVVSEAVRAWPGFVERLRTYRAGERSTPDPRRVPEIDGLRGLAIAAVVFHHTLAPPLPASFTWPAVVSALARHTRFGVDLFFVLSGFVLYLPLAGSVRTFVLTRDRNFFYQRRAWRLVPVYVCALGFGLLVFGLPAHGEPVPDLLAFATFTYSFVPRLFMPPENIVLWSLGVEVWFSIAFPLLVTAAERLGLRAFVLASLTLGLVTRFLAFWIFGGAWGVGVYLDPLANSLFGVLGAFAAGMGLARLWADEQRRDSLFAVRRAPLYLGGALLLYAAAAVAWDAMQRGELPARALVVSQDVVTAASSLAVLGALAMSRVRFSPWRAPPLLALGVRCYSIYAWHWMFILLLLPWREPHAWSQAGAFWDYGLIVAAVVLVSYEWIEKPLARRPARALVQLGPQ